MTQAAIVENAAIVYLFGPGNDKASLSGSYVDDYIAALWDVPDTVGVGYTWDGYTWSPPTAPVGYIDNEQFAAIVNSVTQGVTSSLNNSLDTETVDRKAADDWLQGQIDGIGKSITPNRQTSTTFAIAAADRGSFLIRSNASAMTDSIPTAGGSLGAGWYCYVSNEGPGALSLTPSSGTISGGASLNIPVGAVATILSNGVNYESSLSGGGAGAEVLIGAWDASSGSFPSGAKKGYSYRVSVAGTVSGQAFSVGDQLIAIIDGASTTTYAGNWLVIQGTLTSTEVLAALGTVGTAGTYGSATQAPIITTDAYGRITSASNATIPILYSGQIVPVLGSSIPSGWPLLKLNGAIVSRSAYPNLWAYAQTCGALFSEAAWSATSWGGFSVGDGSTTFRLPDFRGEFQRFLDDGRGIDTGRTLGSAQGDAFQGHRHAVSASLMVWTTGTAFGGNTVGANSGSVLNPTTDGTNGTPRTASETRPRNVPLLACIAY